MPDRGGHTPECTVVGFEGRHRATGVLRDLRDLQAERTMDLADAVAGRSAVSFLSGIHDAPMHDA
jgi:hypothetical protein